MDWQQFKQYLEHSYDFYGRIDVGSSSGQHGVAIHPAMRLSASLALKTIYASDRNRLVILLPNRLDCARWLATLCTFQVIKDDYQASSDVTRFSPSQILLVRRCVVEFLSVCQI